MPEMVPVQSSNLSAVAYDDATGEMTIRFKDGGVYRYPGVPRPVYEGLLSAPSAGGFFHANIRNVYRGIRE